MVAPVEDTLAEAADSPLRIELVREAVKWPETAKRPAIIAGGGTRRGKALLSIAEKLRAPVICTPGGNGAFPWHHELSLQSWALARRRPYSLVLLHRYDLLGELPQGLPNYYPWIVRIDSNYGQLRVQMLARKGSGGDYLKRHPLR